MKRSSCVFAVILSFFVMSPFVSVSISADWNDVEIHGFVSQGYLKTSQNNYLAETEKGTFEYNEAGLNFSVVYDQLRIGAQLLARDMGTIGNHEVELDWGMGDYRLFDALGVRFGRVKLPYGFYNQSRDVDLARVSVLLPSGVYDESVRDILAAYDGVGIYGNIGAGKFGDFDYEAFYGTVSLKDDSLFLQGVMESFGRGMTAMLAGTGVGTVELSNGSASNQFLTGGVLRYDSPLPGFRVGVSYFTGETEETMDIGTNAPDGPPYYGASVSLGEIQVASEIEYALVYSLEYTWENLIVSAEWLQWKMNNELVIDTMGALPDAVVETEGWYAQAAYQFTDWLTLGVYYSEYYPDANDKDGENLNLYGEPDYYAWQKEIVPSIRFDVSNNWIVKLETHFINGVARTTESANPDGREKDWELYAVKTTFSF